MGETAIFFLKAYKCEKYLDMRKMFKKCVEIGGNVNNN
jgi:hypothetical protein